MQVTLLKLDAERVSLASELQNYLEATYSVIVMQMGEVLNSNMGARNLTSFREIFS